MRESYAQIEHTSDELSGLINLLSVVDQYGVDSTSSYIIARSPLLTSTSSLTIALETLNHSEFTELALESIVSSIHDKVSKMSAHLIHVFKECGNALSKEINDLCDRINSTSKKIAHYLSNTSKSTLAKIKAHPFKTVLIVIATIGALVTVGYFINQAISGPTLDSNSATKLADKVKEMVKKIKWPFRGENITEAAEAGTTTELGWIRSSVNEVSSKVASLKESLNKMISSIQTKCMNYLTRGLDNTNEFKNRFIHQALDNESADHFQMGSEYLTAENDPNYEKIYDVTGKVSKIGLKVPPKMRSKFLTGVREVMVFSDGKELLVELPISERDSGGRLSGIAAHLKVNVHDNAKEQVDKFFSDLINFQKKTKVTITEETLSTLRQKLLSEYIKRQRYAIINNNKLLTGGVVVILAGIIYLLWKTIKKIVVKGLEMIRFTFDKILKSESSETS